MRTCQTCSNLKSDPAMSKHGFNLCSLGPAWKFWPLKHTCSKWQQESAEKLEKRIAWLRKRGIEGN